MGGVGTFSRDNRTLYIGGVRRVKGVDLQELVVRNFIEVSFVLVPVPASLLCALWGGGWQVLLAVATHSLTVCAWCLPQFGELESVRVIWDKSIAFVRYKLRAASEFAKEAMADQVCSPQEAPFSRSNNRG